MFSAIEFLLRLLGTRKSCSPIIVQENISAWSIKNQIFLIFKGPVYEVVRIWDHLG